eukprot:360874-Chlamydomonas_euryale.AAC.18
MLSLCAWPWSSAIRFTPCSLLVHSTGRGGVESGSLLVHSCFTPCSLHWPWPSGITFTPGSLLVHSTGLYMTWTSRCPFSGTILVYFARTNLHGRSCVLHRLCRSLAFLLYGQPHACMLAYFFLQLVMAYLCRYSADVIDAAAARAQSSIEKTCSVTLPDGAGGTPGGQSTPPKGPTMSEALPADGIAAEGAVSGSLVDCSQCLQLFLSVYGLPQHDGGNPRLRTAAMQVWSTVGME